MERPAIFVDGTSRRDVIQVERNIVTIIMKKIYNEEKYNRCQGVLGDCWLLSTCAALAKKESLLHRVLDPGQVLHGPGYTGNTGL